MTRSRMARRMAGLLVSAALLSSCTDTPPTPPATSPIPSPRASTDGRALLNAAGVALEFPVVELSSAEPLTLPEVARITEPPTAEPRTVLLALGDDTALVTQSPAENYLKEFVKSDRIGLFSNDGAVDLFADTSGIASDGKPRQVYAGDLDDHRVVWMETSSTNMYESNWRLFTRDIDGGAATLVAAAEEQRFPTTAQLPLVGGDPFPRLSNGLVWWWTAHEQPAGSFSPRIMAADPAGGEPIEMLPFGTLLSPVTDGVVALQHAQQDATDTDASAEQTGLVLIDVTGKVSDLVTYTSDLEDDWAVESLASADNIVAVTMGNAVLILDTGGTPIAKIPLPEHAEPSKLAVCAGKVAFAPDTTADSETEGANKVVIYDTRTRRLAAMDVENAAPSITCSEHRLAWTFMPPGDGFFTRVIADW